jgi:hypothetical protein
METYISMTCQGVTAQDSRVESSQIQLGFKLGLNLQIDAYHRFLKISDIQAGAIH